ncbi:MAG: hypothetical protein IJW82_02050 [Clostridia bacterium]|nr:hypothetical protein [Clostridia bacterium]
MKEEKNIHKGHFSRLRKQFTIYPDAFTQHQTMEVILSYISVRKDVNPLAHRLIDKFGSVSNVCNAKKNDLLKVNGVSERIADYLISLKGMKIHLDETYNNQKIIFKDKEEINQYVCKNLEFFSKKDMGIISISSKGELLGKMTTNYKFDTKFYKLIYDLATGIKNKVGRIVVIEIRDTEYYKKTSQDIENLEKVHKSLKNLDIELLNYIVVTQNEIYDYENDRMLTKIKLTV